MKRKLFAKLFILLLGLTSTTNLVCAQGNSIVFTYNKADGKIINWGTGKLETYDVAIFLKDAGLTGKQVLGVEVPFVSANGISNVSAWLSKKLQLDDNRLNAPDIESVEVVPAAGYVRVNFKNPYTITDEGVYVGYSFTVDDIEVDNAAQKRPLRAFATKEPNAFWIHTTQTNCVWQSRAASVGYAPLMKVFVGGAAKYAASLVLGNDIVTTLNKVNKIGYTLWNHGSEGVASFEYALNVNNKTYNGTVTLPQPLMGIYNTSTTGEFTIPEIDQSGSHLLSVNITKINGADNAESDFAATALVHALSSFPVHRPLLEEYTGLWCGHCPRGYVGLEEMNKRFPNEFIGVSYHYRDQMAVISPNDFPSVVSGYPSAFLERSLDVDAYSGLQGSGFGLDKIWKVKRDELAPADVLATAFYTDATQTKIDVKASVTFPFVPKNANYALSFILTADSLSDKTWKQSNYLSGDASYASDPLLKEFYEGSAYVTGLIFNDVFVGWSGKAAISGSIDNDNIRANEAQTYNYAFDLNALIKPALIHHKEKVNVITLLIDRNTNEVVNAHKTRVTVFNAIENVNVHPTTKNDKIYDLSGRQITCPTKGIYIINGKKYVK
ncbi:MAG: hypothetical protein SOX84_03120 [Prevotella sp.]|nr:hypothetical protein [Prevotella sp.]